MKTNYLYTVIVSLLLFSVFVAKGEKPAHKLQLLAEKGLILEQLVKPESEVAEDTLVIKPCFVTKESSLNARTLSLDITRIIKPEEEVKEESLATLKVSREATAAEETEAK